MIIKRVIAISKRHGLISKLNTLLSLIVFITNLAFATNQNNSQFVKIKSMKHNQNLIPRKTLFGNPDKTSVRISPDGQFVSYIAPLNGTLNIYVSQIDNLTEAMPITSDSHRGIMRYMWATDSKHILYMKDKNGDENWQLHSVDIQTNQDKLLANFNGARTEIINISRLFPHHVIIGTNNRRKDFFDIYKLNILDGSMIEIFKNDEFGSIILDDDYNLRFASKLNEDGSNSIYKFENNILIRNSEFMHVPADDLYTTNIVDFNKTGNCIYIIDSRNRDTGALFSIDLKSDKKTLLYENDKVDVSSVVLHPTEKYLQAVGYNYLRSELKTFDDNFAKNYEYLKDKFQGEVSITSRSDDDRIWIAADLKDDGPVSYYKFDTNSQKLDFLFYNKNNLNGLQLSKMHPVVIKARDGLELVSYLTMPLVTDFDPKTFKSKYPVPLMIWVHGGPTVRDEFGYSPIHQWLANRGFAVLSVNYRGSTGFGKRFINAGHGEWSRKAHTDLIDAVDWAISHGITTQDQVAIGGGSYGGYASLVGITFTPDVFKCAVDIVGMSNLVTLLETIPPYWKPALSALEKTTGGNTRTEEGRKELLARSPITMVDNIKCPLIIGQGANDPRVKQAESEQIVALMREKNIPVTYVLYPEEGHGFAKPENRISFYAMTEEFLHSCFNTRYEEVGEDLNGAKFEIKSKS